MKALKTAIELCDGVTNLACKIGVSQPVVSNWLKRKSIPANRVIDIESATGGKVTRQELRPDIYPPEDQAA